MGTSSKTLREINGTPQGFAFSSMDLKCTLQEQAQKKLKNSH